MAHCKASGFTYLGILLFVAVMGVVMATAGTLWSQVQAREKEQELLFVGSQYREAIHRYFEQSPGGLKEYPKSLDDLVEDRRMPEVRRFLRKKFRDPITNDVHWGIVKAPDGGLMGVYSLSERAPLKQSGFDKANQEFEGKKKYSEWRFY